MNDKTHQVRTYYYDPRAGGAYVTDMMNEDDARGHYAYMKSLTPKGGISRIELMRDGRIIESWG